MFPHSSPSRLLAALGLIGCLTVGLWAAAQPPATEGSAEQRELQEMEQSIVDIDELKLLNTLKLTTEQIDKLVPIITTAQNEYNTQMAALDHSTLKKHIEDIRTVRKTAIAGGAVSTEQFERIRKAVDAHLKSEKREDKRREIHDRTLSSLSQKMRGVLTLEQVDLATKTAKEETEKTNKGAKGTDAQWFNAYVKGAIMSYPRIVPLLKEMRAARETGAAANTGT
jgi:hypothetical protein